MYSESIDQELHNEAPVAPEGSQDRNKDQHTVDQNSETQHDNVKPAIEEKKGTRKPYDGSKPHGVSPKMDKLVSVEMALTALKRLKLRYQYLSKRYDEEVAIIQDPSKEFPEKFEAKSREKAINEQISNLKKLKDDVDVKLGKLKKEVEGSITDFIPSMNKIEF